MAKILAYHNITRAKDEVLGALHREGGELSYPELVSLTGLPYETVSGVLEQLQGQERVQIIDNNEFRLVRLPSTRVKAFFGSVLGL